MPDVRKLGWEDGRRSMYCTPSDINPCESVSIVGDLRELCKIFDILPGPKGRSGMNERNRPEVRDNEHEVGPDDIRCRRVWWQRFVGGKLCFVVCARPISSLGCLLVVMKMRGGLRW